MLTLWQRKSSETLLVYLISILWQAGWSGSPSNQSSQSQKDSPLHVLKPSYFLGAPWRWYTTLYTIKSLSLLDVGEKTKVHLSVGGWYLQTLSGPSLVTVGCEKLDPLFFLNNSLNIQRRTPKPAAMCFYWAVWHFNFFDLFALMSTLTYLERCGS